ncbi:MAG TPA: MMPL family transporter [Thermoleophilaceae bacterium]|jgi:RND superfamily putative drug exporter
MQESRNLAARAGRWSAQHRKTAILGWIAFVVVAVAIGSSTGTKLLDDEDFGTGDSRRANQILAESGFDDRIGEQVLVQAKGGRGFEDPGFRAAIADVERRLTSHATVKQLQSPLAKGHGGQISGDGRSTLILFQLQDDGDDATKEVLPVLDSVAAAQRAHPGVRIEQFGDASSEEALDKAIDEDFKRAEFLSLPITLAILLIAFGALVAAGLPLLLALAAVAAALGLIGPISQLAAVDEAVSSVVLLVGLAVGVDYCLFYIRREREERAAGKSEEAALAAAAATSGRAVLVSGFTVMVAMAGLYLTNNTTFVSFGTGTIVVVAIAMLASITVLPATLSKLGDRIDKGRVPLLNRLRERRAAAGGGGAWAWVLDRVLRHPVVSVAVAGGLLVALTIPAFGMHTVNSGAQGLPAELEITKTYNRIQAAFPGGPLPALVVVQARDVTEPRVTVAIERMKFDAIASGRMQQPIDTRVNPDRTVALVSIPLVGNGTNQESIDAMKTLRDDVVPANIDSVRGLTGTVGGSTALSSDFNEQMTDRAPYVFAFVLGLAFLLLMVTFRSLVIPLKAIVLNLLSVGAAYGLLVLVFQDGRFESLLNYRSIDGVTSWLPLFLFVILFGLSMDYHVLILSRVREAFDRGMSTEEAVSSGIRATAGVVTSAAIVMVAVFSIFATLSGLDFKMMGVGLGAAVLIDATIVRAVLLPAGMKLLGDANWYLPRWLEWLPRVAHEEPQPEPGAPVHEQAGLAVALERGEDRARVTLSGELDLSNAHAFAERLREAEVGEPGVVEIDLRGLTFMDSSGLAELFAANRRARERGRRVVILKDHGPIERVLNVARVEDVIDVVDGPAS